MPRNQAQIHGLLRKSLVGELLDTQFYLFSARSKRQGNVTKLRALYANKKALATDSEYFNSFQQILSVLFKNTLDDPALVEVEDHYTLTSMKRMRREKGGVDQMVKDTSVETLNFARKGAQRIITSRRVLVTDTAFNTWQALLYYLYTDEIVFAPLRSQGSRPARRCSIDGPPPCSLKSMYRLACKINHDKLQAKALAAIRSSLTEPNVNILQECSLSLKSRFPSILEVETKSLLQLIATATAISNFSMIASADLPYEADV
ncbi:uncharacterized protein F5891DRAFT_980068 [Suillus fuscotomentosus]|uniref:Uncharacterized protein n=1 Tax=Suillus fuscotomentosus TaxID=1912939 RepID=A0AAD4HMH0_9AGAM|nr:uncharacterized protein F5891DRAFT_980068 [Suillus fuscotomentosus]KAG1900869.1 hypothetical protein F5891DRAFT_980068 [Suillus fuscotomentosus]